MAVGGVEILLGTMGNDGVGIGVAVGGNVACEYCITNCVSASHFLMAEGCRSRGCSAVSMGCINHIMMGTDR